MNYLKKLVEKINANAITRNLVLAFCGLIVFVFVMSLLLNLFTRHNSHKNVPDFAGMSIEEASNAARHASLKIEVNDSLYIPAYSGGTVLDQSPAAGAQVKPGRRIFVTVNSFKQKMVEVPYVTGYSLRQAKNNLEVARLEIDKLVYRSDLATNNVLEQYYKGKLIQPSTHLEVEVGSGITLIVGMGAEGTTQTVPKLVGFPLNEAKSRLWELGLNVGKIEYDGDVTPLSKNEARVYAQSPDQGYRVGLGSTVSLKLTLDQTKITSGSKASDKAAKNAASEQLIEEELIKNTEE